MPRSGKFDVIDDSAGHVAENQPIRKSLLHFRPAEKLFRRATTKPSTLEEKTSRGISTSDGTGTETINENSSSAVSSSEISMVASESAVLSKSGPEFQPEVQYRQVQSFTQRQKSPPQIAPLGQTSATKVNRVKDVVVCQSQPAVVSKSGPELFQQPEVKCRSQVQSRFEPSGSLRDRWRMLNDEFKQLYQQRNGSNAPTETTGDLFQGQTTVPKINRYVGHDFSD